MTAIIHQKTRIISAKKLANSNPRYANTLECPCGRPQISSTKAQTPPKRKPEIPELQISSIKHPAEVSHFRTTVPSHATPWTADSRFRANSSLPGGRMSMAEGSKRLARDGEFLNSVPIRTISYHVGNTSQEYEITTLRLSCARRFGRNTGVKPKTPKRDRITERVARGIWVSSSHKPRR